MSSVLVRPPAGHDVDPRPSSPDARGFRTDIQALRALAVVLVVVYHADISLPGGTALLPGGYVGVDVFFVISGFVIARMLETELTESGTIDLGRFVRRRVRRLLPALALMTASIALLSPVLAPFNALADVVRTGVAALLVSANLHLYRTGDSGYFEPSTETNPLLHTWSLSVEEQFYLLFPMLLLTTWRWSARRRDRGASASRIIHARLALSLVGGASFLLCVALTRGVAVPLLEDPRSFAFYGAPTRAWEFIAGALLAFGRPRHSRIPPVVKGGAGLALVAWSATTFTDGTAFPGLAATIPVLGTCFLITAGHHQDGAWHRSLSARPLQWIGDRSYGWYPWPWPCIVFTGALLADRPVALWIAALASLAPAALSHRLVEQPIRSGRVLAGRTFTIGMVALAVPLAALAGLEIVRRPIAASSEAQALTASAAPHADTVAPCREARTPTQQVAAGCHWTGPNTTGSLVLVGDSYAGHLTEGIVVAALSEGLDVTVATLSACPMVAPTANLDDQSGDCRRHVRNVLSDLEANPPEVVVVASSSATALAGRDPTDVEAWRDGLVELTDRLTAAGSSVVVAHPVPTLGDWHLTSCATVHVTTNQARCGSSRSLRQVVDRRSTAMQVEQSVVEAHPRVVGFDPLPDLCVDDVCRPRNDGSWLYRDGAHLNVEGASTLVDSLTDAIGRARTR